MSTATIFLTTFEWYWVSQKKYGVADYRYFKNGNTQQCNIFRHNEYNFCLVGCEISTPYVKHNESYELKKNDVSNGTYIL